MPTGVSMLRVGAPAGHFIHMLLLYQGNAARIVTSRIPKHDPRILSAAQIMNGTVPQCSEKRHWSIIRINITRQR